jgi:hypothetical protein
MRFCLRRLEERALGRLPWRMRLNLRRNLSARLRVYAAMLLGAVACSAAPDDAQLMKPMSFMSWPGNWTDNDDDGLPDLPSEPTATTPRSR